MACSPGKRCDGSQKQKIGYSICIYTMFFVLGWIRGLFGPSFIDLQFISHVSLKLGSWISTLNFFGSALGCVTGGFLYDKMKGSYRNVVYGTGLILLGIVTVGVPWCFVFVLMAAAHFIQGLITGVIDTVGNADMMVMWTENKMMYFFVEFSYSLGAFLAPIFVAPFVLDVISDNSVNHGSNETSQDGTVSSYQWNSSSISVVSSDITTQFSSRVVSNTSVNMTLPIRSHRMTSRLYIPYSITAALAMIVCLPFFFKYFMERIETNGNLSTESNDGTENMKPSSANELTNRVLPSKLKAVCLIVISSFIFLGLSLGETFMSFIAVYCVDEIGFSPTDGALVSAVSNVCGTAAIIVAIFASRLNTLVFLGIHTVGTLLGMVALLFSSIGHADLGVWISSAVVGYFKSMIFSLTFTWTNNYITPTTGRIASLFMVCTCTGTAVVPILLGWLMADFSKLWFCFLLTILTACSVLLYTVGMILTKYVTTFYGKTFDKAELTDMSLTEKLNKEDAIDVGEITSSSVKSNENNKSVTEY